MTTETDTELAQALRKAFALGQTYWQQADSEYTSQHRKADVTRAKFDALVAETIATHDSRAQPGRRPDGYAYRYMHWDRGTIIRFSNGEEINGSKPLAAIPYYFDEPPAQPASVADELDERESVAACLGDDASSMLDANPNDERALNMQRAAELLWPASQPPAIGHVGKSHKEG